MQHMHMNPFASSAPCLIVVTEEKAILMKKFDGILPSQTFSQIDIGLACAHLCLQATDLGLSTCILGWFQEDKLKTLLHLPEQSKVRLVICLGYAANSHLRQKMRKDLNDIYRLVD